MNNSAPKLDGHTMRCLAAQQLGRTIFEAANLDRTHARRFQAIRARQLLAHCEDNKWERKNILFELQLGVMAARAERTRINFYTRETNQC